MSITRRNFVKKTVTVSVASLSCASLLVIPERVQGKEVLKMTDFAQTMRHLFRDSKIIDSQKLRLKLPKIAENGAVVPITISSDLENIEKIYILVENNPVPLSAEFTLSPQMAVYIKGRLKMAKNSDIVVIAVSRNGQLYRAKKAVKVSRGGCG